MGSFPYFARQLLRALDVSGLAGLVAAAQEDDHDRAAPGEIDAVSRPVVDAKLADTRAHWLDVAEQPERQAIESRQDRGSGSPILESAKPSIEDGRSSDLYRRPM
jgi:hypothetical protein